MKNSALIVIDIQKDFVEGLPEEMEGKSVVENAKKVINVFRNKKKPIIFYKELHRINSIDYGRELDGDEGVHCVEGTEGADYYEGICPRSTKENEYEIGKRRYSCFIGTDLQILLNGLKIEGLYVIGLLTDVCVHYTCADAHQYDYRIKVVKEAVGGSSLKAHTAALDAIEYLQHGAVISIDTLE